MDDCLVLADKACIRDHMDLALQTFEDLRFIINYEKSILTPSSTISYIGFILDSLGPDGHPWLYISKDKLCSLKRDIRRTLVCGAVTAKTLAKICGQAIAMCKAIWPGKLKL